LETEIHEKGTKQLEAGKVTFRQLADYCIENHYQEATYDSDGVKLDGVRSVKSAHIAIRRLVEFFGDENIRKIDFDDLKRYRKQRLSQKTKRFKKPIQIATVNRELSKARKLFNVACAKQWLMRNPFTAEEKLIQPAAEKAKERVLTGAEEIALMK